MDYDQKMKKIRDTLYDIPIEIPDGLRPPDDFTRGVILGFKIGYEMGKHDNKNQKGGVNGRGKNGKRR